QQDFAGAFDQAAHDNDRVYVVHPFAGRADQSLSIFAAGYAP
ncbi:MAG: hypothetical protein ACI8UD_003745, partial [Planctomycetota bacterium]